MKTKRKIALASTVILLLATVGYGTYALMTASRTVSNVITAGTVKIELNKVENDKLVVMPATTKEREVIVSNTGNNDCYVRVKLKTVVTPFVSETTLTPGKITLHLNSDFWTEGTDGFWYYNEVLKSGKDTPNLLKSIQFADDMGNEYQNAKFSISVSAQAVQAKNNAPENGSVLKVTGWPSSETITPSGIPGQ